MKKAIGIGTILVVLILCSAGQVAFGFYKWVDDQGNLHVTDYPPPAKYAPKPEPEPEPEQAPEKAQQEPPAPVSPPEPPPVQQVVPPPPPPPAPAVVAPSPAPSVKTAPPAPPAPTAAKPAEPTPQTIPTPTAPKAVSGPVSTAQPAPGMPIPISPAPPPTAPTMPKDLIPAAGIVGALLGTFLLASIGIVAVYYLYYSLCLFKIARKLNVGASWLAWVPGIQYFWPFVGAAGKPASWILVLLFPLLANAGIRSYLQMAGMAADLTWTSVLLLLVVIYTIIRIILWMSVSQHLGKSRALGLLMLLPIVNLVVLGYLAFSKSE